MNINKLFSLEDKVAIITGGSKGLGLMMAEGFAEAGAKLVLCSRKLDQCEEAAIKIRALGAECHAIACDVSDPDDVEKMVNYTIKEFGRVDILVNNAGMAWGDELEDTPLERWDQMYNINVRGTFLCTTAVGKHMIANGGGKIINLTSMTAIKASHPDIAITPAYASTKGALLSLTRSLARYWAKHNINVNGIAPGIFPSNATKGLDSKIELMEEHIPLGRLGYTDDFKGTAVFLASPAANYITGHILVVDGGMLA
ncbi:MAG: NAD(P)-dependent dehydrogenase (short-subunit alcohol dehydrogenase family) [Planctomycetota bacterium]|jgi:NAD(P)-dependent dehydrogenase (short-subunit alcohol dehydrogenase family)